MTPARRLLTVQMSHKDDTSSISSLYNAWTRVNQGVPHHVLAYRHRRDFRGPQDSSLCAFLALFQEFTPILAARGASTNSLLRGSSGSGARQTLSRTRNGVGTIEMQHNKRAFAVTVGHFESPYPHCTAPIQAGSQQEVLPTVQPA